MAGPLVDESLYHCDAAPAEAPRVRVLVIAAPAEYGGLDRLLGYACEELLRQGALVDVIRVSHLPDRPSLSPGPLRVPASSSVDLSQAPLALVRRDIAAILRRTPAECVFFVGSRALHFADTTRALLPAARLVSMLFNPVDGLHGHRLMAPMLDAIIVETAHPAVALANAGEAPDRIVSVANGTDLATFRPGPPDPGLAAALGVAPGRPVVAFAGRLSPEKGPLDFVATAALLAERDVGLLMLGTGPQHNEVGAAIAAAGLEERLRRHSVAPERMADALRLIDVLVVPSYVDSHPQVVKEAMATGVAVVATRVGGIPSMISDRVDGLLCPPGNPAALADAAWALAGDTLLRRAIGAAARRRALAAYDMRHTLPRLAAAILGPALA